MTTPRDLPRYTAKDMREMSAMLRVVNWNTDEQRLVAKMLRFAVDLLARDQAREAAEQRIARFLASVPLPKPGPAPGPKEQARGITYAALYALRDGLPEQLMARAAALREATDALQRLRAECAGMLSIAENEIRDAVGVTNVVCLRKAMADAEALLTPPQAGHVHVRGSDPTCYGCVIALQERTDR